MSEATPRPWRASTKRTFTDRGGYIDYVSDPSKGALELVGENMRPDDAALIVRAVNAHDDLVAACLDAFRLLNEDDRYRHAQTWGHLHSVLKKHGVTS